MPTLVRPTVKGFQVAPAELEGCILDHPDAAAACVVGVPDDYLICDIYSQPSCTKGGEVPMVFVVLTAEANHRIKNIPDAANEIKESIIKYVAKNKIKYKHLAGGVKFITAIPTSPSGKLLRRVLREEAKVLKKTSSKL
ncbi:hypothetical protein H0H92_004424 [Tricholoma furcatifolium]|nr:hypothetical protein H0H92_004424 [Tricholoma furcatifolium]